MKNKPCIIKGGVFEDNRGRLDFVNDFDLGPIKRFYFTTNNSTKIFRGWQGHKIERRWFYCVKGGFEIKIVEIDDWDNPSDKLEPLEFILEENNPNILCIPKGCVNGFRALEEDSKLLVMSDYALGTLENDDFRFENNKWKKS